MLKNTFFFRTFLKPSRIFKNAFFYSKYPVFFKYCDSKTRTSVKSPIKFRELNFDKKRKKKGVKLENYEDPKNRFSQQFRPLKTRFFITP